MDKNLALIALSESDKTKFGREDFATQTHPQQVFSAIWWLESEVCNGGFWQYFANSSAETAYFVLEALETIGATKTAGICKRAMSVAFPNGLPMTPEEIRQSAEENRDRLVYQLDPLDQEFYGYGFPFVDDLTELLYEFVLKHPNEFGSPPFPERTRYDELRG